MTSNTLILVTLLTGSAQYRANLALTGASLVAFLVSAFVFARLSLCRKPRHRRRWWLLLSLGWQLVLIILPAVLDTTKAVSKDSRSAWILLAMLAASAGPQVVLVRLISLFHYIFNRFSSIRSGQDIWKSRNSNCDAHFPLHRFPH